jgi:hypothetical protein
MFVEPSMGQAGIPHYSRNRGASQAFGANPPRSVVQNLLMDLGFMLRSVSHGSLDVNDHLTMQFASRTSESIG